MQALITPYLDEYFLIDDSIDKEKARKLITEAYGSASNSYQKQLEEIWYNSLLEGKINYSVYNDKYYFTDVFYCWYKYSRKYIQLLSKLNLNPSSILDVGNGIGYSTRQLKTVFPNAQVIGSNMKGTFQYDFNVLHSQKYGYEMVDDITILHSCDLIFASEFLEHIQSPIDCLNSFIKLNPTYIVLANSFNTHSVGHFTSYLVDGKEIDQSKISRIVNDYLRKNKYTQMKTGFWNNKPTVWKKLTV